MLLEKLLPLVVISLVGFFLKRKNILHKKDGQVIIKLLANIIVPASIISALANTTIDRKFLLLPVIGFFVVASLLGIGFVLVNTVFNLPAKTKGAFLITFATLEIGTIGYAIIFSLFGSFGLTQIVLFDTGNALAFFTLIHFVAYSFKEKRESFKIGDGLLQIAKTPLIWANCIGLLLNVMQIHNVFVSNLLSTISQGTLVLIMLLLGIEFEPSIQAFLLPSLAIYTKTCIGFALGCLIIIIFGFTGVTKIVILVSVSLPASLLTLVYATDNDLDAQFVANLLSVALPFAMLLIATFTSFLVK